VLVRHAKSDWGDPSLTDHDRPLAPRGIKALARLSEHVAGSTWRPQIVLCSSARRTRETLGGIRPALGDAVVELDAQLYGASAPDVLARVRRFGAEIECAMVIGHNPGLHDLAVSLVGDGPADRREQLEVKFPTGALIAIGFDGDWSELSPAGGRLEEFFTPRAWRP
jgi:phosphohistidine phosphatase